MTLTYLGIIAVILIFINYYPLIVSRDFIDKTKQEQMLANANVIASIISQTPDGLSKNIGDYISYIDITDYDRLLVTDNNATIVFDSAQTGNISGKKALISEIFSAIGGDETFNSKYDKQHFEFTAAVPIILDAKILGSVYMYKQSRSEAQLLNQTQKQIMFFSLILSIMVLSLSIFFAYVLTDQIRALSKGVANMKQGKYDVGVTVGTNDELGRLAEAFNELNSKMYITESKRREFVSNASHELKTPLASIRLLVDSIINTPNMSRDILNEFLSDIDSEIERLSRITQRLFLLTRIDSAVEMTSVEIDASNDVQRAVKLLNPLAMKRNIEISSYIQQGCIIEGPQDSFSQIVYNLIDNAIKYNKDGGTVLVRLYNIDGNIVLKVRDNGIGISQDEQKKIFSRFYRVDKAHSRQTGGIGLGLSIVKANTDLLGGTIKIDSELDKGTLFTLTFKAKNITSL